jgi:hypothetical protein
MRPQAALVGPSDISLGCIGHAQLSPVALTDTKRQWAILAISAEGNELTASAQRSSTTQVVGFHRERRARTSTSRLVGVRVADVGAEPWLIDSEQPV